MGRSKGHSLGEEPRIFLNALDDLVNNDDQFVEEYLAEHGYSSIEIGNKTSAFVKKLIEEKSVKSAKENKKRWTHKSVVQFMEENNDDDPIELIKEKSRKMVLDAFSRGWSGPPFDLVELAKLNGLSINPLESVVDARIVPVTDNQFKIEYNPFQSPARINFSIAHEIGHTFFSDCSETIRYRERKLEDDSWELEFLCNVAAAELLLPYAEFSNEANEVDLDLNNLLSLARKYKASVESVFLRFCEVVDKPCAIAIASFRSGNELKIDYHKSSSLSNLKLKRDQLIPSSSVAYECINPRETRHKMESWEAFDGKKQRVYAVGLSPIKKQTTSRVGLFFVPDVYDKTPTNSIYIVNGDATQPRAKGVKIIAQVINTSGALGYGFGRAMSTKYPHSKKAVQDWKKDRISFRLGGAQLVKLQDDLYVYQMIAQEGIKAKFGSVPLKYGVLREGLIGLCHEAKALSASVHMPAIGAGQAKGSWNVIKGMIYDELVCKDVQTTIYLLPGTNMKPNQSRTLTLFKEDEK